MLQSNAFLFLYYSFRKAANEQPAGTVLPPNFQPILDATIDMVHRVLSQANVIRSCALLASRLADEWFPLALQDAQLASSQLL